jgi:hypothetical protein
MEKMIAYCGLVCHECGVFIATKNDDYERRKTVAREWSKLFQTELSPENINCDGCKSEGGRHFPYAETCEVRKCGMEKGVENCGCCDEYPCETLENVIRAQPELRKRLDAIHCSH